MQWGGVESYVPINFYKFNCFFLKIIFLVGGGGLGGGGPPSFGRSKTSRSLFVAINHQKFRQKLLGGRKKGKSDTFPARRDINTRAQEDTTFIHFL